MIFLYGKFKNEDTAANSATNSVSIKPRIKKNVV